MTDLTLQEIARRQDDLTAAMNRLAKSLDQMSIRIEQLPDVIDRTYVRKDVALERATRVDNSINQMSVSLSEHSRQTQEQFERLSATLRWVVAAVLIPIALAIFALLNANGGLG